jgi:hypothetical protein
VVVLVPGILHTDVQMGNRAVLVVGLEGILHTILDMVVDLGQYLPQDFHLVELDLLQG